MGLQIRIPVDREDKEITVTIDPREFEKAEGGATGGACVVISREVGPPLHIRAKIERIAA
jgi:hypothetical protein